MKRFHAEFIALSIAIGASSGCSASIDDIRRAPSNLEYCHQNPAVREMRRNAHIEFDEMQAHRTQRTEITLLGGPAFQRIPRARAVIRPSLAAAHNYTTANPDDCQLMGEPGADGSRRLEMVFDIPDFIPPDGAANDTMGGPYVLQFWSDNNNDGMLSSEIGHLTSADHLWVRPMCDDGNVYFRHASGLDTPEGIANAERLRQGRFRFDITRAAIANLEARMPVDQGTLIDTAPLVVEANWQGQTVAYVRTVLRCDRDGAAGYELRNIIDPGSAHAIRAYWDIGRDGAFTDACDPSCTKTQEASGTGLDVAMDDALTGWTCTFPTSLSACTVAPDR